jgi:CheY-like chemotaxis protein
MELDVKPFDIRQLGATVVALWAPTAEKKGVKLALDVAEDVPAWLNGDELRVKQILLNLVSNALKFTPEGEVRVEITSIAEHGDSRGVEIKVQDSGIGMSETQQDRLFQDYVQGDASTSLNYGGTGLGLSICRRFCKLMSGEISVQSGVGQGSTFRVRLPLPIAVPRLALDAQADLALDLAGCRILVVDDNDNNRAVAEAVLVAMDAVVGTAQSAVEALDILRWGVFDLVLTDLHMPDMGGEELARRIRRGEAGASNIIIVALTGDVKFTSTEFDAIHSKPIQPAKLLESLARLRWASSTDCAGGSERVGA